jgi:hypothetical protein
MEHGKKKKMMYGGMAKKKMYGGGMTKKKKMAVGGIAAKVKTVGIKKEETPMGTFVKREKKVVPISRIMKDEIKSLKYALNMEGVTDAQKKKIQKLIDAKQAGVDATKKSYKSSTIPTMRGTEEDKEQAKKLKEYQYGKKLLKRADKREKKAGGSVKKKMAMGGKMKPVDKKKNPGLAKLPTEVRNKMGFMKKGGMAKKKMMGGGMTIKKMKHGGKAGKCPRDGIAMRGKTRAGR